MWARRRVRNTKRTTAKRRGSIMTMFAIFLFVLLPLMALVVHVGMITLTRRQMQTAVNAAAREGVRLRDATLSESGRRKQVGDLVSAIYDDDLDLVLGDNLQLGAGPDISFDDEPSDIELSDTDFRASRTIKPENLGVYDPDLEFNIPNEQHGDQVRGNLLGGNHDEDSTYDRGDFDADVNGRSYLVRLRRSGTGNPLDNEDGVSSSGRTIPFLFGRGPYGGPDLLDRRERGTIVRATAIADAVPAMTVGPHSPDVEHGLGPVAIELASWNLLTTNTAESVTISGSSISNLSGQIGQFITPQVIAVGDELSDDGPSSVSGVRYVPIFADVSGTNRIVGFGTIELFINESTGTGSVTKLESVVGQANASASWQGNVSALSNAEIDEIMDRRSLIDAPLLAPALARSLQ